MEPYKKIDVNSFIIEDESVESKSESKFKVTKLFNIHYIKDIGLRLFKKDVQSSKNLEFPYLTSKVSVGVDYISPISKKILSDIFGELTLSDLSQLSITSKKIGFIAFKIWIVRMQGFLEYLVNDLMKSLNREKSFHNSSFNDYEYARLCDSVNESRQTVNFLDKIAILRNAITTKYWGKSGDRIQADKNLCFWANNDYWQDNRLIMDLINRQENLKKCDSCLMSLQTLNKKIEMIVPFLDLISENKYTPLTFKCEIFSPLNSRTANAIIRVIRCSQSIHSIDLTFTFWSTEHWQLILQAIKERNQISEGLIGIYRNSLIEHYWEDLEEQMESNILPENASGMISHILGNDFDIDFGSNLLGSSTFSFERKK